MSLSSTTPSTCFPSATTSGVAPRRATSSTRVVTSEFTAPPCGTTHARTASSAPFRSSRPWNVTPLIRVCAVKGMIVNLPGSSGGGASPNARFTSATMLLPSGVSSPSDASSVASASCCGVTPRAGCSADACRLPNVIVPVLSSSRTSQSPAASTARPDVATTLACIIRPIPATPIADSRPPIVVGIRQTSSATSTVIDTGVPAFATSTL